jgi:AraC-like DNA-binding protein
VPDPSGFQQCLLEIHSELVSYTRPDPAIIGNLLENCLRETARTISGSGKNNRIPENLLAVHRLISTAPARRITLGEMAVMAGMSVPHFCAQFKKSFGLSAMDCLIRHRMHHASHLLADRNLNITEVARQAGYDDLFHFSKTFKKHFGRSPRAMRQL